MENEIEYGVIFSFILYCKSYSQSIEDISGAYTKIVVASAIAEVIFELFDYKPKITEFNTNGVTPEIEGSIEFKNVDFAYPTKPEVN